MSPQRLALHLAGGGAVLAAAITLLDSGALMRSWLPIWLFLLGLPLGALALLMIHALTGGSWGEPLRPALAPAAATLPLLALLGLPLLVDPAALYPWAAHTAGAHQPQLGTLPWFGRWQFALRFFVYFALWWGIATLLLRRGSHTRVAAIGAPLHALAVTLAGYDFVLALDPRYSSAAIGLLLGSAQLLAAMALAARVASRGAPARQQQDLGNLLLAFLMTFAYIAFTEFLIVWSGDLPRGSRWYLDRSRDGWAVVAALLGLLHFAAPFLLLLLRAAKRGQHLGRIALALLAGQLLWVYWLTAPSFRPQPLPDLMDFALLAALGGLWWAFYLAQRERYAERVNG